MSENAKDGLFKTRSKHFLSRQAEQIARAVVESLPPGHILHRGYHVDDLLEVARTRRGIVVDETCDLGSDPHGRKVLGDYCPETNVARIDASIGRGTSDPRRAFTALHEVYGHGVLQGDDLRRWLSPNGTRLSETEVTLSESDERRLEGEANYFARRIAAPDFVLRMIVDHLLRTNRPYEFTGTTEYCVTDVRNNHKRRQCSGVEDLAEFVASAIHGHFGGLSKQVLGMRLREAGIVFDNGRRLHGSDGQQRRGGMLRLFRRARSPANN